MKSLSRRNFVKSTIAAGTGALLVPNAVLATSKQKEQPSLKGKKVLYVYGGWKGHEPTESVEVFVPWLRSEGAEVTVSDTLDSYLNEKLMNSLDLIIQMWTMGEITKEQEKALLAAVKRGVGFTGWHGGIGDSFRNNVEYQFMVGGQWVAHPGGVLDYSVEITNHKDPITKGLKDFSMHSEQYYMHIDPNVNVLAITEFSGDNTSWIDKCVIPVIWKKYFGKGRIFYSSLGHVMSDFKGEPLEIQKRGIRWAAESKYHPKEKWVNPVYR
ncbi:ThuA domain-containing protein [Sunxiuqinia sp. sy24]|uniref:ThuA domain-containing protein n=1 Tax=Sunxiuqinia sp. sy24 TaxID=3461495 RepID=UPI0040459C7C